LPVAAAWPEGRDSEARFAAIGCVRMVEHRTAPAQEGSAAEPHLAVASAWFSLIVVASHLHGSALDRLDQRGRDETS
jgi:hypothetical protein